MKMNKIDNLNLLFIQLASLVTVVVRYCRQRVKTKFGNDFEEAISNESK